MDYKKTGLDVLEAVGGEENVNLLTHCATRLRFEVKDKSKIQEDKVLAVDGVLSVVDAGGQYQVIIGPNVNQAFDAINDLITPIGDSGNEDGQGKHSKSVIDRFIGTVSSIFTPIIPAITGAGMIKAVMALLKVFNLIDVDGQTYAILNFASDAAFFFMPIMLANSCAKVFKMSSGLAMTLAGMMLHPTFRDLVTAGNPLNFFGWPVRLTSYSATVIPVILVVYTASFVERYANKWLPDVIKYIFRPLIVMLVMIPLTLVVLGPIGAYAGDGIAYVMSSIDSFAPWLIPTIMGIFTPVLVMFGLHNGLMPIATTQLANQGYETIYGPGMLASNIAQGAASLAISVKSKDSKVKQTALSTGFTALFGITEPAMYGITLRFKKVLYAVMFGGGVAGLYSGLSGLVRYSFGSPGLATLPVFIGEDPSNIIKALVTVAISFIVTFITVMFIKTEDSQVSQ